jgi:GntR family transcriptional regulator
MKTAQQPPAVPKLASAKGIALHRQLFLVLRDQIMRGQFAPGALLPKEEALCERFGVSRITVRRALADLAAAKLVERRHGRGTFVENNLPLARKVASLSLIDGLRTVAAATEVTVIEVALQDPPADVATFLQLEPGEQAVHALRLRSVASQPLMLTDAWVPARFKDQVSVKKLQAHALYEILMANGIEFGRVVQEITAIAADPARAQLLKTEVSTPLLRICRLMHDLDEHPVQYLTAYLSPEHSRILMEIQADAVNTLSAGQIVHDLP